MLNSWPVRSSTSTVKYLIFLFTTTPSDIFKGSKLAEVPHRSTKKDVLFIIGDWNAKVGSQEIPRETGKFGLEYKMKQGKG